MTKQRRSIAVLVALVLGIGVANQWWVGRQQAGLGERMAALARPGDIHMLSSETCVICARTRIWLQQHDVSFTECTIETDSACAAQFEAARAPGTPVLLVRGQPQLGFDAQRVIDALQRGAPPS
jgi:glutaredoxin